MDNNDNIALELNKISNNEIIDNQNEQQEQHIESVENSLNQFNNVSNELEKEFKDYLNETGRNVKINDIEANGGGDYGGVGGDDDYGGLDEEDFKLRSYFKKSQSDSLENGGKLKKMGVSIKNLTVIGKGADQSVIADLSTPFSTIGSIFNFKKWFKSKVSSTFDILHDVTGFCKHGEMLLVLGRPGSGCSSLLRTICNQTSSYVDVLGSVTYGGISQKEWSNFRGECIYVPEEDSHYPTLTVRETIEFSLKCKTPSNRLPNEKRRTFRSKIYNLLLNMFGMMNQSETMVGNEFVRGISGGERKRITIAESMVSSSSINCYDCSTRGLDAASALDYAKSIRIMSDTLDKTTIASFYQASDSIYNLFDKVLILEKGRCIYFGPVEKAKQYFLDLGFDCEPRKSTPDFLTGVTNAQERRVKPGYESSVPETSSEFELAWKQSTLYQESLAEQQEYEKQIELEQPSIDFIKEIHSQKSRTTSKSSPYTTGLITQIMALTIRNLQIIWGDKFSLGSRYASVIVQAPIYGAVFFAMSSSISGAFTRGGAIFSSILFNALLSEQELSIAFTGRRILQKQQSYAMYRPFALHIAQIITDIPIAILQVLLFSIVSYFMYGLENSGSKFFIHVFILIGFALATNNLYRLAGNLTPSMYVSQNFMNILFLTMMTYTSYIIPFHSMHPWLQWFHWANPFSYAFRSLMANEFAGQTFDCQTEAIPSGPSYTDNQYRSCATTAAEPGQLYFTGERYLETSFGWNIKPSIDSFIAYNICIIYGFWLLFIVCNCIVLEYIEHTGGGYTSKVYKKGCAPKINDSEEERIQNKLVMEATNKMKESLSMPGGLFTWNQIDYTVPIGNGGETKKLLDQVNGFIRPGQMTALMGSSGAGKTTLLDVLAKRKTLGKVEGTCLLNGKELQIDFERITGYVEQMDVLNPGLTVRETLIFAAKLRQEPTVSLQEKLDYVEQVLEMMEMKHLGDALIGDLETGVGISVEERKRTTIGVELVAKPHILFLDEPTSGLDAQSSFNIIKFIRKLADAGMPLVCTIHQPSSVLFEHFDRLLLLAKGGKTVYFGDIGERSKTLTSYFNRNGFRECLESENPAEYILEATGAGVHGKSTSNWSETWKNSPEYQSTILELNELTTSSASSNNNNDNSGPPREYAQSLTYQTWEVYKRLNLIWWRSPGYSYGTFVQSALVGLINGWTFYNLKDSATDLTQRVFFIFNVTMLGILLMFLVLPQLITQRDFFKRDYASKFYHWLPFALSIVVVELPFVLVSGTIFFCCSFWTAGLDYDVQTSFFFWFIFMVFLFYCVSFGQAIGAICVNITVALNLLPVLIIFLFLFCGVMVPLSDIPKPLHFIYYVNPCTHFLESMVTNILKNVEQVNCTFDDFIKFIKPSQFATCQDYSFEFLNNNNGTSSTPGSVQSLATDEQPNLCGYCPYKNGEEYYSKLDWSFDNAWRGFGIVIGYFILNIFLVILFIYLSRKVKR